MSIAPAPVKAEVAPKEAKAAVFGQEEEEEEEEEEEDIKKRKVPLVKLDFSAAEKAREWLQTIEESVPHDKEALFKAKVRWDGLNNVCSCFLLTNSLTRFPRVWLTESSSHWLDVSWLNILAN